MSVRVTFLGSGDAFGSGGRMNACFLVEADETRFLIDCGASSLIAMHRHGIDPNDVDSILLSHLHGDHFGGIPFLVLDSQFVSRRSERLTVAGPPGTRDRIEQAMEVLFPGSSQADHGFELDVVELEPERAHRLGLVEVTPYVVNHPSGALPFALRIECEDKVIAYTGDTEWTESLIAAGRGADLLIAEAYFFDRQVAHHLDYMTLADRMADINPKRLVVTHMSEDMLARRDSLECEFAEDGKSIEL
ncbi:MAG TPA: MBL fold metallo-hydrolase [Solirubrobacterales bacterium]|jgi:ribonuclease BN (tRNA processing enzyme)|nr:MBL fold metallo-hydrolase [Solirubrobacterales bacterium]